MNDTLQEELKLLSLTEARLVDDIESKRFAEWFSKQTLDWLRQTSVFETAVFSVFRKIEINEW